MVAPYESPYSPSSGFASRNSLFRGSNHSIQKLGLALVSPDFEHGVRSEFALSRERLNKLIHTSHSVHRLLIWEQQNLLSSPFHQTVRHLQRHNVHGIFVLLRFSDGQADLFNQLRDICLCLWTKRIYAVEEGCPPVPMAIVVHGCLADRPVMHSLNQRIMSVVETSTPLSLLVLDLIKVSYIWSRDEADRITEATASWLKTRAKWYERRLAGRPIWSAINWEKIFGREVRIAWKSVVKTLTASQSSKKSFRLKRSQSEPIIIPRRKPLIADEILIRHGEQAVGIAAQLKHYSATTGIWKYKHPRTIYLHAVFQELVALRDSVRVKLIRRRQYFLKTGLHRQVKRGSHGTTDRFYTRFQWIKSYSGDRTSQLIMYFNYGSVVQYSVARMSRMLTPCDIQILRGQLLFHSESRKNLSAITTARTLCQLWTNKMTK